MAKHVFIAAFVVDSSAYFEGKGGKLTKQEIVDYLTARTSEDGFSGHTVWASPDSLIKDHAKHAIDVRYLERHGPTSPAEFDNRRAAREGWSIFTCYGSENGTYQLQRCDDRVKFKSDDAAWKFVVGNAKAGSKYHKSALRYLRLHGPKEFKAIAKVHAIPDIG